MPINQLAYKYLQFYCFFVADMINELDVVLRISSTLEIHFLFLLNS